MHQVFLDLKAAKLVSRCGTGYIELAPWTADVIRFQWNIHSLWPYVCTKYSQSVTIPSQSDLETWPFIPYLWHKPAWLTVSLTVHCTQARFKSVTYLFSSQTTSAQLFFHQGNNLRQAHKTVTALWTSTNFYSNTDFHVHGLYCSTYLWNIVQSQIFFAIFATSSSDSATLSLSQVYMVRCMWSYVYTPSVVSALTLSPIRLVSGWGIGVGGGSSLRGGKHKSQMKQLTA